MKKLSTKQLVLSGLFLAFVLLMPFLTAQIPSLGSRLLPMHIPVLLCGFICGWPYGLMSGLVCLFSGACCLNAADVSNCCSYGFRAGCIWSHDRPSAQITP